MNDETTNAQVIPDGMSEHGETKLIEKQSKSKNAVAKIFTMIFLVAILGIVGYGIHWITSPGYSSKVTPGYNPPSSSDKIAVLRAEFDDKEVAIEVTQLIQEKLKKNGKSIIGFMEVEKAIQEAGKTIPAKYDANVIASLSGIVQSKYILVPTINDWDDEIKEITASADEVDLTFKMYDVSKGTLVWEVSGNDESEFSMTVQGLATDIIQGMFEQWDGFVLK